jgi:osmotically-inducible protein OsmY
MENFSLDHLPQGEIVRENVKKEIARNTLLKDDNILVDAEGDEIILLGMVDSLDKKWLAEDIAGDTVGVLHVKNNIHVIAQDDSRGDFYEN